MSKLLWRVESGAELARLLVTATLEESAAVSGATVYRISQDGKEKIAIALPGGQALVIEQESFGRPRRRRVEAVATATESQSGDA
ncbi:MAG: hypothetical protein A3F78_00080 [Burkholderiales bacterium RIFCSPLOWO2_12_FULL_61_40]|nr:MAG: hypothetical protein A3F78_00080 [Burkholderiales bacterium RIFCSPLOWO2_12_FULL_61_40]